MKLTLFFLAASLNAGTITICSDLTNESNSRTSANVPIAPHPVWEQGACSWISFTDTGVGGHEEPNSNEPIATFWESFTLPTRALGQITIWADDTARVRLNDVVLAEWNPVLDAHCTGKGGCEVGEGLLIALDLAPGLHTLYLDLFQLGLDVSGIRYEGAVHAVPEPNQGAMIAVALLMMWALTPGRDRYRGGSAQ